MNLDESQQIELLRSIGRQVCIHREKAGMTTSDLAQKVGISEQSVHLIEQGMQVMDIDLIERIAASLGLSFESLLDAARQS